jgi:hypothetical protein
MLVINSTFGATLLKTSVANWLSPATMPLSVPLDYFLRSP